MSKKEKEIFKETEVVEVYRYLHQPDKIYKKYKKCSKIKQYRDEKALEKIRNKELAILNDTTWPEFYIKPNSVLPIYKGESFMVEYPFIKGLTLGQYLSENEISIRTCANFIKDVEKNVLSAENYIFPDIANYCNIIISPGQGPMQKYRCIDAYSVLFDKYRRLQEGSMFIGLNMYFFNGYAAGLNKCIEAGIPNKQLDIRSLYALLYLIMCNNSKRFGNKDSFYPFTRAKDAEEYQEFLDDLNIPQGSSLYQKTLTTLSDEEPNVPIEDSLLELAELGYEFDKQDNRYCLKKNRWYKQ